MNSLENSCRPAPFTAFPFGFLKNSGESELTGARSSSVPHRVLAWAAKPPSEYLSLAQMVLLSEYLSVAMLSIENASESDAFLTGGVGSGRGSGAGFCGIARYLSLGGEYSGAFSEVLTTGRGALGGLGRSRRRSGGGAPTATGDVAEAVEAQDAQDAQDAGETRASAWGDVARASCYGHPKYTGNGCLVKQ